MTLTDYERLEAAVFKLEDIYQPIFILDSCEPFLRDRDVFDDTLAILRAAGLELDV